MMVGIAPYLDDPWPGIRVSTARVLGGLRVAEAENALERALEDDAPEVREAARKALRQLGQIWTVRYAGPSMTELAASRVTSSQ